MLPEIEQYIKMIEDLYGQVINLIEGLSVEALNWRPIEGDESHETNSLGVLATHIAGMSTEWGVHLHLGDAYQRDRDAEFNAEGATSEELIDRLRSVKQKIVDTLSPLTDEHLSGSVPFRQKEINPRWAILHLIDHTALHLGHMQLTYQLGHNGHAGASPRWFERI